MNIYLDFLIGKHIENKEKREEDLMFGAIAVFCSNNAVNLPFNGSG